MTASLSGVGSYIRLPTNDVKSVIGVFFKTGLRSGAMREHSVSIAEPTGVSFE